MKLLYIINSLGTGGAEKLITDLLPLFKEKNIEIELFLLRKDDQSIFIKNIEEHNIKIIYSPHSFYSPMNIFHIRKISKNYDLIHVHLFPAQYWAALSFNKTPMVVTEHCTTNKRRNKKIYQLIEKLTYNQYKTIITISQKANGTIKEWLNFNPDRFVVIENGINLSTFYNATAKEIKDIPKGTKKIIMVGRFNATKDQPTAIKAMPLLDSNIHLLLVGDGNLIDSCKELAKSLNVDNRVHFLGLRNDVPELLKSCDINLISSHSEGLSISSLECLASGKPLVTSNVNGLKDINHDAGLLFEDNDYEGLANCVNKLLNDTEFYNKIVQRCLSKVKAYDINNAVDKHIEVYKKILKA